VEELSVRVLVEELLVELGDPVVEHLEVIQGEQQVQSQVQLKEMLVDQEFQCLELITMVQVVAEALWQLEQQEVDQIAFQEEMVVQAVVYHQVLVQMVYLVVHIDIMQVEVVEVFGQIKLILA
tara:strand:- start:41 stop:409 length:369 start_codon:yes stop_codon:yes gene_type:complete